MKISTKGRYTLRLMLDMAMNDTGEPIRIKDIAYRQEVSDKYLEQLVNVLNKAGYVKSLRGPMGGYRLTMEPSQIKVGDILRLTEGNLAPVACLEDEDNVCSRNSQCATLILWTKLDEAIKGVIDYYTLEDLVQWQKGKL